MYCCQARLMFRIYVRRKERYVNMLHAAYTKELKLNRNFSTLSYGWKNTKYSSLIIFLRLT